MSARVSFPTIFGSILAFAISAYTVLLLLQACAVQLPLLAHLSTCTTRAEIHSKEALTVAAEQSRELQRRVFQLERELSSKQCVKAALDPTLPLSREGWANQDLSMLYGCWALETTYRTRDIDTGAIRTYSDWTMCFDGRGNGKQTMRSNDGIVCEGPVTAQYGNGGLGLIEPGNLPCQDGGYIHQRQIVCTLNEQGKASCDTLQPETKGEATVGFARP